MFRSYFLFYGFATRDRMKMPIRLEGIDGEVHSDRAKGENVFYHSDDHIDEEDE